MHRRLRRTGGAVADAHRRQAAVSPPGLSNLLDAAQFAIAALTMLVGSTVFSTVGFGIGMTTTPFLLLVLEPQTVVVMLNTVSIALFVLIIFQDRAHLRLREMITVSIFGLLGVPVGVLLLNSASASILRITITALIIALTVSLRFGLPTAMTRSRLAGALVGFIVSVLIVSLGLGGPIMVIFMLARGWQRQAIRVSMSFYFLLIQSVSVVGYGVAGLFTWERVVLILIVTAPVLLGFSLATLLLRRMNERRFRQGVVAVIMLTSVVVLGREVLRLQGVIS